MKRNSEIGIRKVFGALQRQIRGQYITEAFWITIISFGIAIAVVAYLLPILRENQIINVKLSDWINLRMLAYVVLFILLISILSGIYPAFVMVRVGTVKNLKGNYGIKNNRLFHNSMILLHFTISISLIFATFIIGKQIKLLLDSDPGYNKDQVMVVDIPTEDSLTTILPPLKNEMKQLAGVSSASFVTHYSIPTSESWMDIYPVDEGFRWLNFVRVDEDYFDVLGLKIVNGRSFGPDDKSVIVVNQALVKTLDWKDPLGEKIWDSKVIGVVQDFNFHGLSPNAKPLQFQPIARYSDEPEALMIRLNEASPENIEIVRKTWEKGMKEYPFEYRFLDDYYQQQFEKEARLNSLLWYVSILAIVIACAGLFGIVSIKIEQKNKETGLRKIFGANILQLLSLTWKGYGAIIVFSALLAYPITVIAINKWLQTFSNKTTIDFLSLVKAVAIVIGMVFLIVIYQSIRIIRMDPLKSIKYE